MGETRETPMSQRKDLKLTADPIHERLVLVNKKTLLAEAFLAPLVQKPEF